MKCREPGNKTTLENKRQFVIEENPEVILGISRVKKKKKKKSASG